MELTQGLLLRRRSHRTNVTLQSRCVCRFIDTTGNKGDNETDTHVISIQNISSHGICFRFINPVKVNVNDVIRLRFELESEQSVIEEDVIVKRTDGRRFVAAEFVLA